MRIRILRTFLTVTFIFSPTLVSASVPRHSDSNPGHAADDTAQEEPAARLDDLDSNPDEKKMAAALVQHGMLLYDNGDMKGAVNDFCRGLLLDPHNLQAQQSLIQIAGRREFSAADRLALIAFEDQLSQVRQIKSAIDGLKIQRDQLSQNLVERGFDEDTLDSQLIKIKNDFLDAVDSSRLNLQGEALQSEDPLEFITASLDVAKHQLALKKDYIQRQFEQLAAFNKQDLGGNFRFHFLPSAEPRLTIPQIVPPVRQISDIDIVRREMALVHRELALAETEKKDQSRKILELTQQVVDLALKVSSTELQLSDKLGTIANLKDQIVRQTARLRVSERLFNEKTVEISSLEADLARIKLESAQRTADLEKQLEAKITALAQGSDQIAQLTSTLQTKEEILAARDGKIGDLDASLHDVRAQLDARTAALKQLDAEINDLKNTLNQRAQEIQDRDDQLRTLETALSETQAQLEQTTASLQQASCDVTGLRDCVEQGKDTIAQRDARVQDLEGTLRETRLQLEEKVSALTQLNDQVTELKSRLELGEGIIAQKDDRIQTLESSLSETEENLAARKTEFTAALREQEKAVREVTGFLGIYRQKLAEIEQLAAAKEIRSNEIARELVLAKRGLQEAESKIIRQQEDIAAFKQTIDHLRVKDQRRTDEWRAIVEQRDKQLTELKGILNIYRGRLADVTRSDREKGMAVRTLEETLRAVQREFDEKDKLLQSAQEEILTLQQAVSVLQQQLNQNNASFPPPQDMKDSEEIIDDHPSPFAPAPG